MSEATSEPQTTPALENDFSDNGTKYHKEFFPREGVAVNTWPAYARTARFASLVFETPPAEFVPKPKMSALFFTENCFITAIPTFPIGYLAGFFFSAFFHHPNVDPDLTWRQAMKASYKEFLPNAKRTGKNFAIFGGVYHIADCHIQKYRGVHDVPGAFLSGCTTGAVMGYQSGPSGMAMSCMGIGVFSAVIEYAMKHYMN